MTATQDDATDAKQAARRKTETEANSAGAWRASGSFDVTLTPLATSMTGEAAMGRRSIAKVFRGELEATSVGEMLSAGTDTPGSGCYVAIERITGSLHGRRGSFIVHHTGVMNRGAAQLAVVVVPDSGTEELVGITGTLAIRIADGKHLYDFDYALPAS